MDAAVVINKSWKVENGLDLKCSFTGLVLDLSGEREELELGFLEEWELDFSDGKETGWIPKFLKFRIGLRVKGFTQRGELEDSGEDSCCKCLTNSVHWGGTSHSFEA